MSTTKNRSLTASYRHLSVNTYNSKILSQNPYTLKVNSIQLTRIRTGNGVKNFKQKIRNHLSATSALSAIYDSVEFSGNGGGILKYTVKPDGSWGQGVTIEERMQYSLMGFYGSLQFYNGTGWVGNADGRASNKFLGAVRETQTYFSAPTFIGELRESLRMIRRPAGALWENLLGYEAALRKTKRSNPKRWIYSIPDLWLEWSFGWKPFLNDIDDAFKAAGNLLDEEKVVHISKAAVDNRHVSTTNGYYLPNGMNYSYSYYETVQREEVVVRYRGDITVSAATTFSDKAARWGFNPAEFAATAWELLPWSFLVDYFTTIGDFIDASGARTAALRWTCKTVRRKATSFTRMQFDPTRSQQSIPRDCRITALALDEQSPAWFKSERKRIDRSENPVILPDLSIRWEGPKWGQIANMSALLGSFNANLHFQTPRRRNYRL